MFDSYFSATIAPDPLLWSQHDPWLVALSVLVSMGASAVALHMAALARAAESRGSRQLALGSGALALGSGVWTMHYIGMLAFAVCGQGRFDPGMTALSVLPSLGASWVALRMLVRERVRAPVLLGSGVLVGAGIGAMHYIGMAASELAPLMRYDARGFALSIVVAVLLAVLALWVRFGLQQRLRVGTAPVTVLAGGVMGLAIAGMHYTGMAALRFVEPIERLNQTAFSVPVQTSLSLAVAVVTVALSLVVIAVNAGLRYRDLFRQMQRSESRLRAITDTAIDGIITINGRGIVQSFNGAAEHLLGWRAEEVIGRNVSMLMPEPHQSAHDGYLSTHLTTGRSSIIGRGREVEALRKDGSVLPIRLAVGRVALPGEALFVGFITDISARRAMESALRRREEQLRTLVGNIPGVAFRCRNEEHWPMEFISDAVLPLTGWSADDFLQGSVHFSALIDPGDAKHIALDVDFALRQSQPYHVEYRITTREGQRRWISEYGRGAADEQGTVRWIDGVILDITTTKEHTAQFVGTVQALNRSEAVAEFDLHGNLLDANTNFLALMGYSFEEAIGQQHALFCPPPAAAQHDAFWQRLAQGEFQSGEFQRLGKGGREVWVHATYNPIRDADDKVCKVILLATDLSQRRAMEQDLRTAKERAEAAAAARASFLANMSHEIRTPMNAIIGFTEALLDSPLDTTQRRQLGTVQHAARSLLHLLNGILDTAKLDKGAVVLEVLDFSLRQLCQQMLDTLRISAARKGLPLVLDYPESEPDHLRGLNTAFARYLGLRLSLLDCTEARSTREALKQAVSHLRNAQDEVEQHLHHTRKEQARLDTLLASLHLGLVFVDAEWRVLYANPLFSQLWFLPPAEQIKGCPLSGLLPALAGNGPEEGAAESEYKLEDGRIVLVRLAAIQGGENCQENGFLLLCEDVTAARASAEQLVFLAERDTLTGVFNRRRFQVEIDRMWRLAERRQRRMGLLAFDLNDFKLINDNHGHAAGDEVLIEIARAVSRTVRQDELFCRLGGDEFAVLLPEADVYDSTRLAMRIESCVSALQFEFDGVARRVSASIGIAVAPDHANCADALSAAADAAMYQAKKENPQGCWRVFDPGLHVIGMSRWGMGNASAQDGRLEPTVIVDGSSAAAHDTDQLFAACQREADSLA